VVGFVDDEDRSGARVGTETGDFAFDLAIERGAGAFDTEPISQEMVLKRSMTLPVESET
jgi:hypothetical protein